MSEDILKPLMDKLRASMEEHSTSEQQEHLLIRLEYHLHNLDEVDPEEPSIQETLNVLIEDLSNQHPRSAQLARNVMEALASMGI